MLRKRRFFVPNVPIYVVQHGNNRQPIFFDDGVSKLSWPEVLLGVRPEFIAEAV